MGRNDQTIKILEQQATRLAVEVNKLADDYKTKLAGYNELMNLISDLKKEEDTQEKDSNAQS